jgi:NADH dehydrogenase
MILVTGATGFIGRELVSSLVEMGYPVRLLIRPSPKSPNLPRGKAVEVAVSSLSDARGLRAAMVGVDTIYHLAGVEWRGAYADLVKVDIQGTRAVLQAAIDARVDRFFMLSHLGADRASAFPVLKAKGIAEEFVRRSGIDFTIMRSAVVYGPQDGFTTGLARLLAALPFIFFMPGEGRTLVQPIWVRDLATCLTWALEDQSTRNQMYELGGPEYLTFRQVIEMILREMGVQRRLVGVAPPYLRVITILLEAMFPSLPVSIFWLDYLAANRTCSLDTLPRYFNLLPRRMSHQLDYLRGVNWQRELLVSLFQRRRRV